MDEEEWQGKKGKVIFLDTNDAYLATFSTTVLANTVSMKGVLDLNLALVTLKPVGVEWKEQSTSNIDTKEGRSQWL